MTSPFLQRSTAVSCLLVLSAAVSCGGSYVGNEDGDTGGSTATGGQTGAGGNAETGGASAETGGEPGTGGEGPACCLAEAICDEGDLQIESEADCPIGGECYSSTICCSTVWCMEAQALCDAIPTCLEGETEVPECPEGSSCVKRALCGTVIICEGPTVVCDVAESVHVHWVAHSAQECQTIDYECPEYTTAFSNECGCGCQQPDTCPESIDCEPGGTVDPLCNSEECPYSPRAL